MTEGTAVVLGILALFTSLLSGAFYGMVMSAGIAVLRYARRVRGESYAHIIVWCTTLFVSMTTVMWIWPYSYFYAVWLVSERFGVTSIVMLPFAIKPVAAILTIYLSNRLYISARRDAAKREELTSI